MSRSLSLIKQLITTNNIKMTTRMHRPSFCHPHHHHTSLHHRSFTSLLTTTASTSSFQFNRSTSSHHVGRNSCSNKTRSYTTQNDEMMISVDDDPVLKQVKHLIPLENTIEQVFEESQDHIENGRIELGLYLMDRGLLLVKDLRVKAEELEGEEARKLILQVADDLEIDLLVLRARTQMSALNRTNASLPELTEPLEKDLLRVIQLTDSGSVACFNYATYLSMVNRSSEAVQWLTKSIAQEQPEWEKAKSYLLRAEATLAAAEEEKRPYTASELARSLSDASRVIVAGYRTQDAYFCRGRIIYENYKLGQPNKIPEDVWSLDQALEDLSYSIDLYPLNAAAYRYRALVYQELGQNDLAEKDLQHIQEKFAGTAFSDNKTT